MCAVPASCSQRRWPDNHGQTLPGQLIFSHFLFSCFSLVHLHCFVVRFLSGPPRRWPWFVPWPHESTRLSSLHSRRSVSSVLSFHLHRLFFHSLIVCAAAEVAGHVLPAGKWCTPLPPVISNQRRSPMLAASLPLNAELITLQVCPCPVCLLILSFIHCVSGAGR